MPRHNPACSDTTHVVDGACLFLNQGDTIMTIHPEIAAMAGDAIIDHAERSAHVHPIHQGGDTSNWELAFAYLRADAETGGYGDTTDAETSELVEFLHDVWSDFGSELILVAVQCDDDDDCPACDTWR